MCRCANSSDLIQSNWTGQSLRENGSEAIIACFGSTRSLTQVGACGGSEGKARVVRAIARVGRIDCPSC